MEILSDESSRAWPGDEEIQTVELRFSADAWELEIGLESARVVRLLRLRTPRTGDLG